jgi:hypothetical protein
LDYDGDGHLDILLVGQKIALYRGDGKGRFTNVSAATGVAGLTGRFLGCAVADYDDDGHPDLYLSGYRAGKLLHNEGGASFRDVSAAAGITPQPWGASAGWADVDGDGKLDLYVGNYVRFSEDMEPLLCDFYGHLSACGPKFFDPEIGVFYRNEGGGRFRDVTKAWGANKVSGKTLGVAFADFDGSGRQSLFLANDQAPSNLLQNLGKTFKETGAVTGVAYDKTGNVYAGMGADWGDFDNDGRLDLASMSFGGQDKNVYRNEGSYFTEKSASLGFLSSVPYVAFGVKWFDYDNDGWLDLIMANGHVQDNIHVIDKTATYKQPTMLYHNEGGVRFMDVSGSLDGRLREPIIGRGLAIGDYDDDGLMDVLLVDSEGPPQLWHNESASGNWVGWRLRQPTQNRDAYGALVTVEVGGKKLLRQCQPGGSYLSSSDVRVHFGLGDTATTSIDRVTVRWPDGKTEEWANVRVGRYATLERGSGQPIHEKP